MSDTLKRAEELLAGITPGKWESIGTRVYLGNAGGIDVRSAPNPRENAAFIAAAPSLVRELVAEVKALREERDELKQRFARYRLEHGDHSTDCGGDGYPRIVDWVRFEDEVAENDAIREELTALRKVVERVREEAEEIAAHWGEHTTAGRLAATIRARLPEVPK